MNQHCFFRNVQSTLRTVKRLSDLLVAKNLMSYFENYLLSSHLTILSFSSGFCTAETTAFSISTRSEKSDNPIRSSLRYQSCLFSFIKSFCAISMAIFSRDTNHCMMHSNLKMQRTKLSHKLSL